ncbi:unnamed protein product [Heterobilharzia americana]|nr:unnamed protein product [Heterobilharzia americana]
MGKRRGWRKKDWGFTDLDDANDPVETKDLKVGCLTSKNKRRIRRKLLKKIEHNQFLDVCDKYLASKSEESFKVLPDILPHSCSSAELLSLLSSFVNRYVDVFNAKQSRIELSQFYDPTAYLTFQIAPYICQTALEKCSDKSFKPKYQPLWRAYERFAVNSLPGGFPLPSWAWSAVKEESMPRKLRSSSNLLKQDRKLLKALKGYQAGHIQRLVSVARSASSAPDRWNKNIPPPPMSRTHCQGIDQVLGLLCRLPNLVHIKDDKYSHLDVISSEPPVVCVRYSCIAAEQIPDDTRPSDLETVSDQLLDIAPYGRYAVRLEDFCITPLPSSYIQECSLIITEAVSNFMASQAPSNSLSVQKACFIPDEVVISKLVDQLSLTTGMNKAYSLQCLTECQFDLDSALYSFQKVHEAGVLPAEAFLPS